VSWFFVGRLHESGELWWNGISPLRSACRLRQQNLPQLDWSDQLNKWKSLNLVPAAAAAAVRHHHQQQRRRQQQQQQQHQQEHKSCACCLVGPHLRDVCRRRQVIVASQPAWISAAGLEFGAEPFSRAASY
jgi:hypothetical protein